MLHRSSIALAALAAVLLLTAGSAQAFDESKYPDWKGQWRRAEPGPPRYDPSKPGTGFRQEAPLTEEYKAVLEASLADQKDGGQGNDPTYTCLSPGMPRVMSVYDPMEIVITEGTTHILIQHVHDSRRIFTDGRAWPDYIEPSFVGYSIGKWVDTDGDGRYDTLEVETRGFRGPRVYDATGLPLHRDNESVFKERIHLDKADQNLLHLDMTTMDGSVTRPWSATKSFRRQDKVRWMENNCAEGNTHVAVGHENYMVSPDGYLMPVRKDQKPPDLRYFNPAKK